ncbi:hypothetical protein FHX75_12660 [Micromonospora palomenae]|uniref:Uncharacterized protein n=1 Tax=Micromonospora palomenae TaxID=1461247 RepID=A0A561WE41_9ACTN|nr:hypothetical protein [Micromonospora palomenae]TWG22140.1 hypothetical protein FHX75_12660 [Micromonospora palomenae]
MSKKPAAWVGGIAAVVLVLGCGQGATKPEAAPTPTPTRSAVALPTMPEPEPAPTALTLPPGRKMTPARWCTTYAKTFIQLEAKGDKISDLRRTQYKNGVELDNSKREAQADALWAEVEAFDPGQAIADALVSLPHTSYKEAALAAPDGADANSVNVDMWHAYDLVGKARESYEEEWNSSLFGPDDAGDAHFYASNSLTEAIGEPPNGKPGSGKTGLCYVQQPWQNQSGARGTGGTGSTGGGSVGCEYHGRPKGTWKVWRWGDWSC